MSDRRFPDVPGGYPFPALELEVLAEWRRERVFERTLEKPAPRGDFVFFEGPPTANNVPHVGHVVTRVVKDLVPRYRTMRGWRVPRKAGWDTHGLAVEIEVEKRLGFSGGKQQIEAYGIAEFNRACLESVHTYERQWRAMTERIGYWVDLDHAYHTYSNDYIESVWWALATLFRRELLVESYKIQPYCARCGTTLSSHEVAQNYKETDDPSIWTLFPARPGQRLRTMAGDEVEVGPDLRLSAWTTTPWTTLANVALAVHPQLTYRLVEPPGGGRVLLGEGLDHAVPMVAEQVGVASSPRRHAPELVGGASLPRRHAPELVGGASLPRRPAPEPEGKRRLIDLRQLPAVARFHGRDLDGLLYDRPFTFFRPQVAGRVVLADYVTATEGTGLVHTAPPFGEDDYQTGLRYDLPLILTVDTEGRIIAGAGAFSGLWFKDADPLIIQDLRQRGLLLHVDRHRHSYPFCWRCDRPLLYYATRSWFVKTSAFKSALVEKNREIDWHPEHVGSGRFGNWLENVVDWALSRSRYWGTPLPIWTCDCGERRAIGSYAELFAAAGVAPPADVYDRAQFDPHRPAIDELRLTCPACRGAMTRVPYVIDAWFDAGAMPFAQHHYPFENRELIDGRRQFPADFISEAVDQTRGWFYTLHVLGVLLFDTAAFRTCVVLGHVNDEHGRKMSKRLGNFVEPMGVIEESGADAMRWYFCVNNPEVPSRFSSRLVREAAQKFLLPLWNALSFFTIYANLDGWRPGRSAPPAFAARPALDRWVLLRLDRLTAATTDHLESYRLAEAARGCEEFLDDLTNWYIRRSRDRFWAAQGAGGAPGSKDGAPESERAEQGGDRASDKESAYQALYEVLSTFARLLAPFIPFLAEVLHRHLVRSQDAGAAPSVHLEDWPQAPGDRRDDALEAGMAGVLRIVRLGHAARNLHGLKTRQPLAAVTLVAADRALASAVEPFAELLCDELNVHEIRWAEDRGQYVHHEVRPLYPKTGPRFGKRMAEVKRAIEAADGDALARALEETGRIELELAGGPVELSADELEVRLVEREGAATQGDRDLLVALDTRLTPELVAEGRAREAIHHIQSARRNYELDYADRIRIWYVASKEAREVMVRHRDWIMRETLAISLEEQSDGGPPHLDGAQQLGPSEGHALVLDPGAAAGRMWIARVTRES